MTIIIRKTGEGKILNWHPKNEKRQDWFNTIKLIIIPSVTPVKIPQNMNFIIPEQFFYTFDFNIHLN